MAPEAKNLSPQPRPWYSETELYRIQVRESAKHAIFAMDPKGIVVTWNRGVEEILGYSEAEWIGRHACSIFTPVEQALEVCEAEMNFAADKGFSSDIRWHVRKDGSEIFAHGFMTALRDADGQLLGFSKILSDETKTKELQDNLTESNMALEQFAHVASHDLQEPLRTVGTFAELLAQTSRDKLDTEEKSYLDLIVSGAKRMNTLVQDLLAYARVQTEIDRPTSVSLDQDLETALSQLQALIEETKAVITHEPLPTLNADQGQMVRLFQNLVGNALKYRKPDVAPVIQISAQQRGSAWVITVEDNGIGFDPKYAREIFLPFKRLHGQQEYPGNGVGLAICRRIVEGHGGQIWAESTTGVGTRFHVALPVEGKARPKYTPPVTAGL
jgi:PAS domain S-box-containing protein